MDLLEYIKTAEVYNPRVIKSLGGSDELVKYLMATPYNTNIAVVASFINEEESESEYESESEIESEYESESEIESEDESEDESSMI